MPYDSVSVLSAAVAGALLVAAAMTRVGTARMVLVLVAAFIIRIDAGWTRSLHE